MDEPFSFLDALTAQILRNEVLMLRENRALPPDAVLMVTHNIEEAVYLASRIIVLSHRPGRIIADLKVDLPRPRIRNDQAFYNWTDKIYLLIV
jgi:NitT/TauT family transport system ATP-binding protein